MRRLVVRMRKRGVSNKEVAELVGLPPQTTSEYYSRYRREGEAFFRVKPAGKPKKSGQKLSDEEQAKIVRLLVDKNPRQLQFRFALWTREAVRQLIKQELGKELPLSTVGDYLGRWKFTSKKPIKRAYERKDEKTRQWLEEEYPKIKKAAKEERADIWWADETSCVSLPTNLKGYAPVGSKNKPVLIHPVRKFRINMISAITNTGKSMFALYDESINVDRFIDFMQRVIDSSDKKVYLIVDNLRVHHAKRVKQWIEEHKEKIAIFYLPPYSPEFNPDEYLNQDYKRNANKDSIPLNQKELKENTLAHMNALRNDPEKVASFFRHPSVSYAA
ncbi:IS630 family transposase [Hydrogenimonas sp.]